MKFKIYDVLTHLIPGFIAYGIIAILYKEILPDIKLIPELAIAFVLGYFINTLSSWLEDFYFLTWRGKPSTRLLNGKFIWKVKFQDWLQAKTLLDEESTVEHPDNDSLFAIARRYANSSSNLRVEDLNSNYAFSRAMLTTVLVCTGFAVFQFYSNIYTYFIFIPLCLVSWLRCKQRGYYYAREVLDTYLNIKNESKEGSL